MAETLTLQDMQKHVIKTIVGSAVTSLIIAIVTGMSFYYGTNAAITRLNEKQDDMNKTIQNHTDQINKTNMGMGMSEVQQQSLKERLTAIEEGQKQIMTVLIEIKNNK